MLELELENVVFDITEYLQKIGFIGSYLDIEAQCGGVKRRLNQLRFNKHIFYVKTHL